MLFAQSTDFMAGVQDFLRVVSVHWKFCGLHFLEFAIWGAWYVVLSNFLSARGFSRVEIGRVYATIPLGSIISPLFVGALADKYVNTEHLLAGLHLAGGLLLFAMAKAANPRPFYWLSLLYALCYAPTLSLVNSIIFSHDADLFDGKAGSEFFWIRVFGTIGWIAAGLSHAFLLTPGKPVNERPIQLAGVLSILLGAFCFTLPATPPQAVVAAEAAAAKAKDETKGQAAAPAAPVAEPTIRERFSAWAKETSTLVTSMPAFFAVSLVVSIGMAVYFAFSALFLEQSGVKPHNVGPVMTLGQWVEIFFMLTLPLILGPENKRIILVLTLGVLAWTLRFGLFAAGGMGPILLGVALHGICFDFFFATGFTYIAANAPEGLAASAQALFGSLCYGVGMYLGTEGAGWLNAMFSTKSVARDGAEEIHTNWRGFWTVAFVLLAIAFVVFVLHSGTSAENIWNNMLGR